MYIQQNVEHALAALEENLKTDEGKRMLEEDMVSKNLPVSRYILKRLTCCCALRPAGGSGVVPFHQLSF